VSTGRPIAAGPTIFAVNGKEYVAITVGGTPTSSNGGTASILQVFALPGGGPSRVSFARRQQDGWRVTTEPAAKPKAAAAPRGDGAAPGVRIRIQGAAVPLQLWQASSSNLALVRGRIALGGRPVVGASISVDRYVLPGRTDRSGRFSAPVDATLARRHPVHVSSVSSARVGGRALTAAERRVVLGAQGGISVGYRLVGLRARKGPNGTVVLTGRALRQDGVPVPPVVLLTYRLSGTVRDASGNPVQGATVVTRTVDRNFWTFSEPSNAAGRYTSFFSASDQVGSNPVPMTVQVAYGRTSYTTPRDVTFTPLQSAEMNARLPGSGAVMPAPDASSSRGAIYRGLLVGVSGPGGPIRPVSARWPDRRGSFKLVLPASARGKTLRFWESDFQAFSRAVARPGGPVDLSGWPTGLSPRVARDVAFLRAPR
jgi:hypothetical protein